MKARLVMLQRVPGVTGLPGGADVELLSQEGLGARVILTVTQEPYLLHLRRQAAAGAAIVSALAPAAPGGTASGRTPKQRFEKAFGDVAIKHGMQPGEALLVAEVAGDVNEPSFDHLIDFGDFDAGFSLFDEDALEGAARKALQTAFSGLSLVLPSQATPSALPIGTAAWAVRPESGRLLYSMRARISLSMTSAARLDQRAADRAALFAKALLETSEDVEDVVRLLSQSSEGDRDRLGAFLCAWTGLEMFAHKVFRSTYEPSLHSSLVRAAASSARPLVGRTRGTMRGKYHIVDKFVAVASALNSDRAGADIEKFKRVKYLRDELVHGMKAAPETLPVDEARDLLRKYLRLHLGRTSNGPG